MYRSYRRFRRRRDAEPTVTRSLPLQRFRKLEVTFIEDVIGGEPLGPVGTLVHFLHLLLVERPSTDAAEDRDLVAAFVNRAIAIHASADRQRVTLLGQLVDR